MLKINFANKNKNKNKRIANGPIDGTYTNPFSGKMQMRMIFSIY